MTPDRLQQIEELFHAVRELSAAERAALLAKADTELRREVESLLARQGDDLLLDWPPGEASTVVMEDGNWKRPASSLASSDGPRMDCATVSPAITSQNSRIRRRWRFSSATPRRRCFLRTTVKS